MKHLYINNLVASSKKGLILLITLNWWLVFQHTWLICSLKLTLLSKRNTKKFYHRLRCDGCVFNVTFTSFCWVSKISLYYHCLKCIWIGKYLVYCEPFYNDCNFRLLSKNFIYGFEIFIIRDIACQNVVVQPLIQIKSYGTCDLTVIT